VCRICSTPPPPPPRSPVFSSVVSTAGHAVATGTNTQQSRDATKQPRPQNTPAQAGSKGSAGAAALSRQGSNMLMSREESPSVTARSRARLRAASSVSCPNRGEAHATAATQTRSADNSDDDCENGPPLQSSSLQLKSKLEAPSNRSSGSSGNTLSGSFQTKAVSPTRETGRQTVISSEHVALLEAQLKAAVATQHSQQHFSHQVMTSEAENPDLISFTKEVDEASGEVRIVQTPLHSSHARSDRTAARRVAIVARGPSIRAALAAAAASEQHQQKKLQKQQGDSSVVPATPWRSLLSSQSKDLNTGAEPDSDGCEIYATRLARQRLIGAAVFAAALAGVAIIYQGRRHL
jgi:hypothetical protein